MTLARENDSQAVRLFTKRDVEGSLGAGGASWTVTHSYHDPLCDRIEEAIPHRPR